MLHLVTDIDPIHAATVHLYDSISSRLAQGERVLWLASGGSGIQVDVALSHMLQDVDTTNLSVTLTDERFGPIGHADENWQQMIDAGFSLPYATLYRPLVTRDIREVAKQLGDWVKQQIHQADFSIGLFGIGSDGHTAGIKPTPSATIDDERWAVGFHGNDHERITLTFRAIRSLDEVVVQASGQEKFDTITSLLHENLPLDIQPAQILKSVPNATLYSDYKEE